LVDAFQGMFDGDAWSVLLGALLKLGIAAILGGLIGWERESHGRPAGIRTHMMTVIGVVMFSEVSKHFATGDPTRIAAQIVTGIGFLGAGTILRHGPEIRGLTTAATLWAAAGIGMAVSTGGVYIVIAVAATLLSLFTLEVVERFEKRVNPDKRQTTDDKR
jgi:putative Mg2+ transporter-C (MgtC) family protein